MRWHSHASTFSVSFFLIIIIIFFFFFFFFFFLLPFPTHPCTGPHRSQRPVFGFGGHFPASGSHGSRGASPSVLRRHGGGQEDQGRSLFVFGVDLAGSSPVRAPTDQAGRAASPQTTGCGKKKMRDEMRGGDVPCFYKVYLELLFSQVAPITAIASFIFFTFTHLYACLCARVHYPLTIHYSPSPTRMSSLPPYLPRCPTGVPHGHRAALLGSHQGPSSDPRRGW